MNRNLLNSNNSLLKVMVNQLMVNRHRKPLLLEVVRVGTMLILHILRTLSKDLRDSIRVTVVLLLLPATDNRVVLAP